MKQNFIVLKKSAVKIVFMRQEVIKSNIFDLIFKNIDTKSFQMRFNTS